MPSTNSPFVTLFSRDRMSYRFVAVVFLVASSTCAQVPLRLERKIIQKQSPGCVATFEYPEIIAAGPAQLRERMNAGIFNLLLRRTDWPAHDSGFRSPEAYVSDFMKRCEAPQSRRAGERYVRKRITIYRDSPPVLSFQCVASEDDGGAHPFGTTFFVNFDASTGKAITIKDLVRSGGLVKLASLAEAHLRRDHNLSPSQKLSELSYNFPDDRFTLNENFGVGEDHLVFLFNTYEIGPGAMGPTKIELSFQELQGLLKIRLNRSLRHQ